MSSLRIRKRRIRSCRRLITHFRQTPYRSPESVFYFWKTDGTFVGALEDDALFGTNYPWISAATKLPDGSILVGMAEEREDESADEFLVYRMSGF